MGSCVTTATGYGVSLGLELPKHWRAWEGAEDCIALADYFDYHPGDPAVKVHYGGDARGDSMWTTLFIKDTFQWKWDGEPTKVDFGIDTTADTVDGWNKRLLEVCKRLGIEKTEADCGWYAMGSYA